MSLRIVYMGTPEFAVFPLERLASSSHEVVAAVSQPDRPSGRSMRIQHTPVRRTAEQLGLAVCQPEKIRTEAFAEWLTAQKADLIVTAAYGRILPANLLEIPRLGCLNIHASLLPAYRGASPVNSCIIQGATETGITFMKMDEGMDTGDILVQIPIRLPEDMDAGTLSGILSRLAADEILEVIDGWTAGRILPVPQAHDRATYTKPLKRDDGKVDWTCSAHIIHNLVRGTSPWPGAFTLLNGKRVKIHIAQVSACGAEESDVAAFPPGTVISACPECIRVACGEGTCLEILSLQAEACRRLEARECFHNFRTGTVFGKE